jgi:hypothetical protein
VATILATTVATTVVTSNVVLVAGQLSHLTLHRPGHLPRFAFSLRLEFPFSFGAPDQLVRMMDCLANGLP